MHNFFIFITNASFKHFYESFFYSKSTNSHISFPQPSFITSHILYCFFSLRCRRIFTLLFSLCDCTKFDCAQSPHIHSSFFHSSLFTLPYMKKLLPSTATVFSYTFLYSWLDALLLLPVFPVPLQFHPGHHRPVPYR